MFVSMYNTMKHLHITFDDKDWKKLETAKDKANLKGWREFLLKLVEDK